MNLSKLSSDLAPQNLRSCLISREGRLIYEQYREPRTRTELAKINSCTKSILSALVCIAMDQELLPQPATPLSQFYPQLTLDSDKRKAEITLEHLLTMSAGFNWTEFGGQNSYPRMTRSENWTQFVLEQQMSHTPGEHMEYNSGVSQLLSAILVHATGMSTARFAELQLFGPLGIEQYEWEQDPRGIHTGGFGLRLTPPALLKFGQLYLQQGMWENVQLLSPERIARSTESFIQLEPPRRGGYGWHWWTDSYAYLENDSAGSVLEYYYARGYGGQFVYVLPQLTAVVVLTQDHQGKHKKPPVDVFREWIAPLLAER